MRGNIPCMITADLIIPGLKATSKKAAFRAIAEACVPLLGGSPEVLFDALMARERIGTTGIGGGVAIPHVKLPSAERVYAVLVRLENPIDYDAIDGAPVDLIFMLLAPSESKTTQHLKVLAQVSRFLKDQGTCQHLRGTDCADKIGRLLENWGSVAA